MKTIPVSSQGAVAMVDDEDFPAISSHKWYVSSSGGYAFRAVDGSKVYMHRAILLPLNGLEVDHIDGNPLNNQRANLRAATRQQNEANKAKRRSAPGKYKGVSWCPWKKRWRATIGIMGAKHHVRYCLVAEDAAKAYDAAATAAFGEFAYLNFRAGGSPIPEAREP